MKELLKQISNLKTKLSLKHFLVWLFYSAFLIALGSCSSNTPQLKIKRSETFFNNLSGEPENLHPIRSTDAYSRDIQFYILESLLKRNEITYEWEASLAKQWAISPNGKTFTFELYDDLKWSDGKNSHNPGHQVLL